MGIQREKTRKVKSEFWVRYHQGHRALRDMKDETEESQTTQVTL